MTDIADRNRLPTPSPPILVIGNPENRRVRFFSEAAARLNLTPPQVVAYHDILDGDGLKRLSEQVPIGALVRIESPGENTAVECALIRRGAKLEGLSDEEGQRCADHALEHGRIAHPRLWYRGYCELLAEIEAALAPRDVQWMNHPAEIPLLFDKTACQEQLAGHGIPTPPAITTPKTTAITSYDDLRSRMEAAAMRRVFVKLRYGSSASGVVALQRKVGRVLATTSVELVQEAGEPKLFNSLRVREYSDERDVAAIIDELCRHEIHVEHWLPKAGLNGRVFDLRVLVIAGQARHVVVRTSHHPITNLHLGNQRGDVDELLQRWPVEARNAACRSCEEVAAAFSQSLYFGVDLLLAPGLKRHAVLEANAFGDLLPGVHHDGDDTYAAELRASSVGWDVPTKAIAGQASVGTAHPT